MINKQHNYTNGFPIIKGKSLSNFVDTTKTTTQTSFVASAPFATIQSRYFDIYMTLVSLKIESNPVDRGCNCF